jgi:hypothetical protein
MAHGQAHRRATLKKQGHEMATDETGATEHRDGAGHDSPPLHSPEIDRAMPSSGSISPVSKDIEYCCTV